MENLLTVLAADGNYWQITVLDIFSVEAFPGKEYIAYTFGEYASNEVIKSYISILKEENDSFVLDAIDDKAEEDIVKQAYANLLVESDEG